MKRVVIVLMAVLVSVVPLSVSAHEGIHEMDEEEEYALAQCEVPSAELYPYMSHFVPVEGLTDYESFMFMIDEFGIEEIGPDHPDHDALHESGEWIEWVLPFDDAPDTGINWSGDDGCHGNLKILCTKCTTIAGVRVCVPWPPFSFKVCKIHYRHCIHDKCGGNPCP